MPDVSLNGIEFKIKGSSDEASASIEKLIENLSQLTNALNSAFGKLDLKNVGNKAKKDLEPLSDSLQELIRNADKVEVLQGKLAGLGKSLEDAFKGGNEKRAWSIRGQILSTESAIKKATETTTPLSKEMRDIIENADRIDILTAKLESLKAAMQDAFESGNMDKAYGIREQIIRTEAALARATEPAQEYESAMSRIGDALKYVGGAAGKLSLKFLSAPFKEAASSAVKFATGLKSAVSGLKRIAFYRAIRFLIKEITKAFKEGIENLYGWSTLVHGKFATSMNSLATSMTYFKNSIGAAVAPIINALAPAIDFLIDKVVALINVLNQLFARLTGAASWTKAIKKAQEYDDSVSGAGSAAKKALEYLAPFDELNVLPDPKSGGGGGGNNTDYSGMFEEVTEFSEAIADFADKIREKITAGDWEGLGTLIGTKINEIIDGINWSNLGTKIGQKINALFTTEYWTLKTINFQKIGEHIAELLTGEDGVGGALREIDFSTIGALIVEKMTIIPDIVIGLIKKLDWSVIGKSVGDLVKGAFNNLSSWIQGINWSNLASSVYSAIKNALTGMDVSGVAKSIFTALGSAVGATASFVVQFAKDLVSDIWTAIKANAVDFNGDGEYTGGEILAGILKGIENGIKDIGTWLKTNVWEPFVAGLKSTFGIHSPAETMTPFGEDIWNGVLEGILNAIKGIGTWIKSNIWEPFVSWFKSAFGINTSAKLLKPLGDSIWNGILDGIVEAITSVGSWIKEHIWQPFVDGLKSIFGIHSPAETMKPFGEDIWNGVLEGISTAIKEIGNWVKEHIWQPFVDAIKDKFGIGQQGGELSTAGEDIGKGLLDGMETAWGDLGSFLHDKLVQPLREKIVDVVDAITSPDTWALLGAWLQDIPAKFKQAGINAINAMSQAIEIGINNLINELNETGFMKLLEKLFRFTIQPVEIPLIPDLPDGETTKYYDKAKSEIEARNKKDPVDLTTTPKVTKPSVDPKYSDGKGNLLLPTTCSLSRLDKNFTSTGGLKLTSSGNPILPTAAELVSVKKKLQSASGVTISGSGNPVFPSVAELVSAKKNLKSGSGVTISNGGNPVFPSVAELVHAKKSLKSGSGVTISNSGNPEFPSVANFQRISKKFTSGTDSNGNPQFTSTADFKKRLDNVDTKFNSTANFKDKKSDFQSDHDASGRPYISSTAKFTETKNSLSSKPVIDVVGRISSTIGGTSKRSSGGVFSGGTWHDIATYASGGMPRGSQLFWARERGPELVGTLGGNAAVMNNDQIVSSVSAGVARAIASIRFQLTGIGAPSAVDTSGGMSEDVMYRAFRRALDETDFGGDIELDGYTLYSAMVRRNRMERARTGVNPMMLGG